VAGLAIVLTGPGGPTPTSTSGPDAAGNLSLVPILETAIPVAPTGTGPSVSPIAAEPSTGSPSSPVAGTRAVRIRIARLDVDLPVVEGDGLDAPIRKAAHYPGSAWPGGGSNVYIYGHAQEGMFINLWDAREGDVIELDLADSTTRVYIVDEVLPKVPWDAVEYLEPTTSEQLTLQTSTSYQPTAPRFIVIAHPAP
jgi:LPXTG-site transpeptidase (sortase) family protein